MERVRDDGYRVNDDPAQLDRERVWRWLSEQAYWALGRSREVQDRAIDNSLCVGMYAPDGQQVGFCRYVTDRATFAWLCDVFVDESHRGGLGSFMVRFAVAHPDVAGLRLQLLATRDAHTLYERAGYTRFTEADVARWMTRSG
jgi:GNAT superfamily N-acetyltransferase